jgi:hypothetical protein
LRLGKQQLAGRDRSRPALGKLERAGFVKLDHTPYVSPRTD